MNKKTYKDAATEIAKLRPAKGTPEERVWRDMIHVVTEGLVPARLGNAFASACTNHGIWQREYED